MENTNFAIIPMKTDGTRLDVENIFSIAAMFYQNITVSGWEKWGSNEPFSPFESLFHADTAYRWKAEINPNGPVEAPEGYEFDVRWIPEYQLSGSNYAYIQWKKNYATIWSPAIVGVDEVHHKLLVWDSEKAVWATFTIPYADYKNKAFYRFLQAWIDW